MSEVLLGNLKGPQLAKKLHAFYARQRFISMHTRALSLCSFLSVRDQVSYPQKKTNKIAIFYILIYVFLRWAGHVPRVGEERGVYRILVGKPEGRRPLGRPRRRWVDNIRMDLQEVGCGYMDWIGLAQGRDR